MGCFDWLTLVDATRDALSGNSALASAANAIYNDFKRYYAILRG